MDLPAFWADFEVVGYAVALRLLHSRSVLSRRGVDEEPGHADEVTGCGDEWRGVMIPNL